MMELFLKLLDMSLTAGAVILVVLVLRFFLRKAPKVYSYALWSVVLFRLLCPVSIESGVSIIPAEAGYTGYPNTVEVLEAVRPGQEIYAAYEAIGDALNGGLDTIPVYVKPEYAAGIGTGGGFVDLMHSEVWALVFGRLWPAGVVLMAGYSFVSLWSLRRRLRTAILLRDNIYRAEGIETAFVLGLFRPKIYLPAGLSEEETPYIIRHEQYHIRRGDHIVKVLAFIALCLHWFNPLVWLAFVLAGKDMEMSCDEAVVKAMGPDIRADYSQSLLSLATGRRHIAATPLAFGEGDPKGRIKNVLKWKKPSVKVTVIAVLVCVIAGVLCISDPVQPVEADSVERVVFQYWSLPDGELVPEEDQLYSESVVTEQAAQQLFDLLSKYTAKARTNLPTWGPRASYQEFSARLECADGSYYVLSSWYVNGFSFHPLHAGEDEYDTTLALYGPEGELQRCWTMEYDFDAFFRYWLLDRARERKAQEEINVDLFRRGLAFEELEPGAAAYLNEDIVLVRDGSAVTYQITYSRAGLTVQVGLRYEDGSEYVQSIGGGSNTSSFEELPAGRYTPFVRNVDESYRNEPNATGVVNFDLISGEDYFQKSTPWTESSDSPLAEPVHLSAYDVLHQAILDHHRSSQSGQYFCCESHIILANEEGTRYNPVTGDDLNTMNYYLWVLYQEYDLSSGAVVDMGGAHIPTNITLAENGDGTWSVLNYWEPRDGSYFVEDIQTIFPADCVTDALDSQKFIYGQMQDCYAQAVEYAKTDSDVNLNTDNIISGLLDVICSSPLESSNPQDYIDEHAIEYRELLYYGNYTKAYCVQHLAALEEAESRPFEVDLRVRIMERLLADLGG